LTTDVGSEIVSTKGKSSTHIW